MAGEVKYDTVSVGDLITLGFSRMEVLEKTPDMVRIRAVYGKLKIRMGFKKESFDRLNFCRLN